MNGLLGSVLDAAKLAKLAGPSLREQRRRKGVIIPVRPAVKRPPLTAAERQKRRDSTRAKRARADRKAMTS